MGYLSDNQKTVEELVRVAKRTYALKHQMGNGGNMSVRIPGTDYMIVKGSNVGFCDMTPDALVVTDFDGKVIEGGIRPSKESLLHGEIYKKVPGAGAIMHTHAPWANAWGNRHDQLAFSTYHAAIKLKNYCPVFDAQDYVVPQDYFPVIMKAFEEHPDMIAFILRKHGPVAIGKDIVEATFNAELVEETAQIALLSELR